MSRLTVPRPVFFSTSLRMDDNLAFFDREFLAVPLSFSGAFGLRCLRCSRGRFLVYGGRFGRLPFSANLVVGAVYGPRGR